MDSKRKEELLNQLQYKREKMIEIGLEMGLSYESTIQISQELDELIVEVQKLKEQGENV
ncbi:aspartyl-phosphate phosphatase Spo0E family protein [Alkalibacillus aidingensis]|uniref:aspartyl-phosphate phosphatase Spo0E family protein n=1 Tax=Alkalibacillus aidingensis TaxID=2747607 RepID=UPI001661148F|nr:aspartyl-phosphate phosphatase Spo0E family protein [Alkalibacillus aidingensis]